MRTEEKIVDAEELAPGDVIRRRGRQMRIMHNLPAPAQPGRRLLIWRDLHAPEPLGYGDGAFPPDWPFRRVARGLH
ncbi:hypothetical protein [Actinomadura miaoliensis]|uniref:Uncharacterized protein n=1 Tax=Actinomadura miaoliensis TaxID=430685 RepID=A0ABP7WAX2_9ACTN